MKERCKNVWLAVAGLVINEAEEWLVVKKRYGGLKGKWSLPAGFVKADETVDDAIIREVREETGLAAEVIGLLGVRSGVLKAGCSDHMLIFLLTSKDKEVIPQMSELYEATFMDPSDILQSKDCSVFLEKMIKVDHRKVKLVLEGVDPGPQFDYLSYKIFI
ncbi:MAG: NUDIX domain-containing protein [Bacillus sp. (in: firmicutes)]